MDNRERAQKLLAKLHDTWTHDWEGVLQRALSLRAQEVRLDTLREAARKTCGYCATPVGQMCSVATMQQGSWVHHIHDKPEWGEHCKAGAIHSMIAELEKKDA